MKKIKFFDINYDNVKTITLDLVRLMPHSWLSASGILVAPWKMVESGAVHPNAGYLIGSDSSTRVVPFVDSWPAKNKEMTIDDLHSIVKHQKLPRSIRFSSFDHPRISPKIIQTIAPSFIEKDYTGALFFYKNLDKNEQGPAGVFIISKSGWYGRLSVLGDLPRKSISGTEIASQNLERPEHQNPIVKIVWDDQYGGRLEDVEPIMTVCRVYNMRERTLKEILPFVNV